MHDTSIRRFFFSSAALLILASFLLLAAGSLQAQEARSWLIKGQAVTGINDLCDEAIWEVPPPFPPDLRATFVGQLNPDPDAQDAIPLSPINCDDDIVLATTTDLDFLAGNNFPDADARLKNRPLREAPVINTPDGLRAALPPAGDLAPPFPTVQSEPSTEITLGDWLSARGSLRISCFSDGTASITANLRSLIPNGLYTFWAVWSTTPPGAPGPIMLPLPLGGVPNAAVANPNGRLRFERHLNFCPKDTMDDGSTMVFIDVPLHPDGGTYGSVPDLPLVPSQILGADGEVFTSTLPPGTITHTQFVFPVNVVE